MKRLVTAGLITFLASGMAAADVVVLIDGTRLEGRVEEAAGVPDRVAFTSGTGRIELPRARIQEIIEESDAKDWTHIGNAYLGVNDHAGAVQMFQRALESEPDFAPARKGLDEAQQAIEAQQSERARTVRQQIDAGLEEISEYIQSDAYDEKKFEQLEESLNVLMTNQDATEQQRQSAQRLMRDLFVDWGFARFDRLDYAGAEEKYVRVLEMDPGNEQAKDHLLRIWRNDPSKKEQVLNVRLQELKEEPNNLELNKEVANLLYEMRRYTEAIGPLKKISAAPRFEGQGYDKMLKRSYEYALADLRGRGELQQSLDLYKEMMTLGLAQDQNRLDRLQYEVDVAKIPEGDDYWNMRAQLIGERLQGLGLQEYKERELELILQQDPENEAAIAGLRAMAEERLAAIEANMRQSDFFLARDQAQRFIASQERFPQLVERAQELYNRADLEAKRLQEQARESARKIADNAIEYYERARRDVDSMISQQRLSEESSGTYRFMDYKNSALRNLNRSIELFQLALQQDPSLADPTSMDLDIRLQDARRMKTELTESPRTFSSRRVRRR